MKKNLLPLAAAGAVAAIGLIVALGGLIGHFVFDGPIPSAIAGVALLMVSAAVWYEQHVPKHIPEEQEVAQWRPAV